MATCLFLTFVIAWRVYSILSCKDLENSAPLAFVLYFPQFLDRNSNHNKEVQTKEQAQHVWAVWILPPDVWGFLYLSSLWTKPCAVTIHSFKTSSSWRKIIQCQFVLSVAITRLSLRKEFKKVKEGTINFVLILGPLLNCLRPWPCCWYSLNKFSEP